MNTFLPNGVTDSFADEVELHRADAVSLLTRFASFISGCAPFPFPRPARRERVAQRSAVAAAESKGTKPPDTMQLPPAPSADIVLFARLPNGTPIRGTARLRKLRRSPVTRGF